MRQNDRLLYQWNDWLLQHYLGQQLLQSELALSKTIFSNHFGKHVLLIGVPAQIKFLSTTHLPCQYLLSPIKTILPEQVIASDFIELPFLSGSVDIVLLPHTLEYVHNPRQLLAEACRIIKPEGLICIWGLNPISSWGVKKFFSQRDSLLSQASLVQRSTIKNWLRLADFELEQQFLAFYRPPIENARLDKYLQWMEVLGCISPFAGIYALVGRAKVTPLTPIRLKWKQQLPGIKVHATMPGSVASLIE